MGDKLYYGLVLAGCTTIISTVIGVAVWAIKGYLNKGIEILATRLDGFEKTLDAVSEGHAECRDEVVQRLSTLEMAVK